MSGEKKLSALVAIGIATWMVSQTGSDKLMKGYNFVGPNKGPDLRRRANQARKTLYGMAAASVLGIAMQPLFKKKPQTTQPPSPSLQYGRKD